MAGSYRYAGRVVGNRGISYRSASKNRGIVASVSHDQGRQSVVLGMHWVGNTDVVTVTYAGRKLLEMDVNELGAVTCLVPVKEPD